MSCPRDALAHRDCRSEVLGTPGCAKPRPFAPCRPTGRRSSPKDTHGTPEGSRLPCLPFKTHSLDQNRAEEDGRLGLACRRQRAADVGHPALCSPRSAPICRTDGGWAITSGGPQNIFWNPPAQQHLCSLPYTSPNRTLARVDSVPRAARAFLGLVLWVTTPYASRVLCLPPWTCGARCFLRINALGAFDWGALPTEVQLRGFLPDDLPPQNAPHNRNACIGKTW